MTRPHAAGARAIGRAALNAARGQLLLQGLLRELAIALVPRGVTPKQFSELAAYAFADAAATVSQLRNGRVNQSRVAVLTGLRRAEVRKLLAGRLHAVKRRTTHQSTIETVLAGWFTDKHFVGTSGGPKSLPVSKGPGSFVNLVKKYGGDVPPRAVLDELCRLRIVKQVRHQVRIRSYSALAARSNFIPLARVMPLLLDLVRLASEPASTASVPSVHRVTFPARSRVDLRLIRDRCASSIRSLLRGLSDSLSEHVTFPKHKNVARHAYALTVTVMEHPRPISYAASKPVIRRLFKPFAARAVKATRK